MRRRNIAEEGKLINHIVRNLVFTTADNDIWLKSHRLKSLNCHLCRFRLKFITCMKIWNQRNHDNTNVFTTNFVAELTDGFKERLGFNITNRATDFNNRDSSFIGLEISMEAGFDFVCHMRNDLNSSSSVITMTFFGKNRFIDFTCRDIGMLIEFFINETLVMSEIKVGFSAIIGNENLTVLDWRPGSRVNVQIRIKLLPSNLVATGFE